MNSKMKSTNADAHEDVASLPKGMWGSDREKDALCRKKKSLAKRIK